MWCIWRCARNIGIEGEPHQAISCADLSACCSFRHGLRRATFLREEGFGFPHNPPCLSLWERCRGATERAGSLFEGAGLPPCGKTEGVLQIGKMRMRFALIRICQLFCPLSHLLRKCQLSQRESREAGANFWLLRTDQLVSPFGRDVAQRQRGLAPSLRELDLPQAKTEGVLQIDRYA